MMSSSFPFVGACLWLSGALCAQVWPAGYDTSPGNAVMNAPFSVRAGHATTSTRMAVVLDASTLPFAPGTSISQLSFRRDVSYQSNTYGSSSGRLLVRIGAAANPPGETQDVRFSRLYDGAPTLVYNSSPQNPFVVPSSAAPPTGSAPFDIVVPLTAPYTWTGGPLIIDIVWTPDAGSSLWRLDAVAEPRPHGSSRTLGLGCAGSNGIAPTHFAVPESTNAGGVLELQLEGVRYAPPGSPENVVVHVIGFTNVGPALPLPLTVIGGPAGCVLQVQPAFTLTLLTSNRSLLFGRALSQLTLPALQALVGADIYSQFACFDTALAVALPMTLSDVQVVTIGPILPPATNFRSARTIWKYGATGQGNESGRMVPDSYGPVIRFN